MKKLSLVPVLALTLTLASIPVLHADVKTEAKGLVTLGGMLGRMMNLFGGKAAREGVASTVAVKGDRKATLNDASGQIVDLAEEKIYDLDLKKKTYKVTTFAELRRRMEEAQRNAAEDARKQEGEKRDDSKPEKEVEIDFEVKNTDQSKSINGFSTK